MSIASTRREDAELLSQTVRVPPHVDEQQFQHAGHWVGASHRIVRHLASGGMGHVYLTEHVRLGVYAAAKIARTNDEVSRQTIAHEASMLSQLDHPNIVRVLDEGRLADGTPYVLMEYVTGLDLDCILTAADGVDRAVRAVRHSATSNTPTASASTTLNTMSLPRGLGVLRQLAWAVDYLHAQGIVHGDIKPGNVLIDARGGADYVKLVDFGIAWRDQNDGVVRGSIGTPAYMAPEQARGEHCGPALDVYAVAALSLELFTGHRPYDYGTAQDIWTAVLTEPPALPSHYGLWIPGFDEAFGKALHADPNQRFKSASEFVNVLSEAFVGGNSGNASHPGWAGAECAWHPAPTCLAAVGRGIAEPVRTDSWLQRLLGDWHAWS